VRDQIRKMVVGGPLVPDDKARADAVSESEDEEEEAELLAADTR
jgi:hypothetical protein